VAIDVAYCGLDCGTCPAFHAAERLTIEERQAVADEWNIEFAGRFGKIHTVASIDCVGCTHEGPHAPVCESRCDIRKCGIAKEVATCAECAGYACATLAGFLDYFPEAKTNLEARRAN
jgi:hypothetical protein